MVLNGFRSAIFGLTISLAVCVSLLTVFAFGVLAPFMMFDLRMGAGTFGRLTGVLFAVAAVTSPWAGILVDRFDGRRILLVLFFIMGVAWLAMASSPSPTLLLLPTAVAGLGMALASPVTTSLVIRHGGDRRLFVGVAQAGSPAGAVLAGTLLPTGALAFGWRGAVLGMSFVCVIGLLFTGLLPRGVSSRAPRVPGPAPRRSWLAVYAFLINSSSTTALVYLPLYAYEQLAWSPRTAGLITGVAGIVTIGARLLWPRAIGQESSIPAAIAALALTAVVATTLVLLAAAADSSLLLWLGIIGLAGSANAWVALMMSAIMVSAEAHKAGRATGQVMRYGFFGGAVGPAVFGYALEAAGSYVVGWIGVLALFAAAGLGTAFWRGQRTSAPV